MLTIKHNDKITQAFNASNLLVFFSLGHSFLVSHHLRLKVLIKSFSCKRRMARLKSSVPGSFGWNASASPLATVRPGTE